MFTQNFSFTHLLVDLKLMVAVKVFYLIHGTILEFRTREKFHLLGSYGSHRHQRKSVQLSRRHPSVRKVWQSNLTPNHDVNTTSLAEISTVGSQPGAVCALYAQDQRERDTAACVYVLLEAAVYRLHQTGRAACV